MSAIEVTHATFDEVVLKGSTRRPVLVDFWAAWCAPCRALAPTLARLADELADRFTLAKVDTEREPELAARYHVRGIPDCRLFVGGEVVDEFTGALPERAVRDFLLRALPSPAAASVARAKALLARDDAATALRTLDEAQAIDPADEELWLTRADVLLALGRARDAQALLAELDAPARRRTHPVRDERRLGALQARAALSGEPVADLQALAREAARTPLDCAARLAYARALAATRDYERALAELLAIVRADRGFGDDVGRRTMIQVFDALPPDSDLVRRYRRELAAAIN